MSSPLRYSTSPSLIQAAQIVRPSTGPFPQAERTRAPTSEIFSLTRTARRRFSEEAARADRDFRLLLGHANLLDELTLHLNSLEQTEESQSRQTITKTYEVARRVQPADPAIVVEELVEEVIDDEDYESDLALTRVASHGFPELVDDDDDNILASITASNPTGRIL